MNRVTIAPPLLLAATISIDGSAGTASPDGDKRRVMKGDADHRVPQAPVTGD